MDRVERSQNRAPDTVTEMNFGLRFAENGASRVTRQTWTMVNVSENCYSSSKIIISVTHDGTFLRIDRRRYTRIAPFALSTLWRLSILRAPRASVVYISR